MNNEERQELGKYIVHVGVYYGKELSREVVSMMIDDFDGFSSAQIMQAYQTYRKDPRNRQFPLPAQIMQILNPLPNNRQLAIEAAARIKQAISKFGWPNGQAAREYIGELGWRAVERFGGWPHICAEVGLSISPDTFYAQTRDLCQSTLELGEAGIHDQPIMLEGNAPQGNKVLELVGKLSEERSLEKK